MILETNSNSSGCYEGIKRIVPSFILDVTLPSMDVYSDFSLVVGWYLNGHFKYAISMTVPILLQFLSTIYKWVRLEKRKNKIWSWPILILQFWPQWRAIQVMRLDFKNDPKAEEKKKELMREITTTEPFLEAWPSIIIMTIIFLFAQFGEDRDKFYDYCRNNMVDHNYPNRYLDNECHEYLD